MNILVIKTTSLGDVLHATPHLRAIRQKFPEAHITVLTARGSAQIYAHHAAVDRLVLFDHAAFKRCGIRSPGKLIRLIEAPLKEVNDREYDLAFDLQGLLRTVVFLYFARARARYVKGRWPGLAGFRNKQLHAIDEMSGVLALADIPVNDTHLVFYRAPQVVTSLRKKLRVAGLEDILDKTSARPTVLISPFTRWKSKNWPLRNFILLANELGRTYRVVVTGTEEDRPAIERQLSRMAEFSDVHNLAGAFGLGELAEVMAHAALVISGDSFPMHLASAVEAPLIALFGPTDERKTGPRTFNSHVMRPQSCDRCDRPNCEQACLSQISVPMVVQQALGILQQT